MPAVPLRSVSALVPSASRVIARKAGAIGPAIDDHGRLRAIRGPIEHYCIMERRSPRYRSSAIFQDRPQYLRDRGRIHEYRNPHQAVEIDALRGASRVRRIAAWKSEPPNPLTELWKRISLPAAREVERLIPDGSVRAAIIKAYDVSESARRPGGDQASGRRAGPRRAEAQAAGAMRRPGHRIGLSSQTLAAVEGGN